jgi:hypothetical protein
MSTASIITPSTVTTRTARALLLCDRIDTARLERANILYTSPLAFPVGKEGGIGVVFRYGVIVFIGVATAEQEGVIENVVRHSSGSVKRREEENAVLELAPDIDEQIPPGGPIRLRMLTPERAVLIAEALAKSVVLARDEREVAEVFDVIEPFARKLASTGHQPGAAPSSNTSATRSWCSSAYQAVRRSRRNPMCSGTGLGSNASMPSSMTSTSCKSGLPRSTASSP